jgi:4-carboxymuconolactone decarboxylase
MARVPYPDPAGLSAETRGILGQMQPLNIFRMMAGGEGLLRAFSRMGNYLLFRTKLDATLREIAIIRVGVLSRATYELHQHEQIGRALGMSDVLVAAIHAGPDDPALSTLQAQVLRYVDDVAANVRAGDATFGPLRAALSVQELQELTMVIGYYMMVSRYLETFDIEIEGRAGPLTLSELQTRRPPNVGAKEGD